MTLSKNEQPMKTKTNKYTQIKIHYKHLKNITKINKYKKTEQHFYDAVQNRKQLHFGRASKSEPHPFLHSQSRADSRVVYLF